MQTESPLWDDKVPSWSDQYMCIVSQYITVYIV